MQVKDLKPNAKNPRKISKSKLSALKKSVEKFGDLSGFVFNKRSKTLISGHQRSKTIPKDSKIIIEHKYEEPTPAGTVAEGYVLIGGERFKYREVDVDSQWEMEALLAANKHGGEWDQDLLRVAIADVGSIELTGFDIPELEAMNIEVPKVEIPEIKTEESDEEYVKNTKQTTEQIPVEKPSNQVFSDVKEETEIKGKRFVIIIDCPNQDVKDSLREKLQPEINQAGCKIF